MKKVQITKNPYIIFSPFLIVLIVFVVLHMPNGNFGDEINYLAFAENLLHDYNPSDIYFVNGPGYSILLIPFIALRLPLVCITLMNALFYYFSIVLLYKTLHQFTPFKQSLFFSLFLACYIDSYKYATHILTETFSLFLIALIIFNLVLAFNENSKSGRKKHLYLSGLLVGYLTLTKPIFGYVMLFMLFGSGLLWIFNKKVVNYRKGLLILLIALITTTPYLIYTYHLTGKIFYWSSYGGVNLYWMSSPFEGEYGYPPDTFKIDSIFLSNHQKDFEEISKYKGVELDDAYKRIAINNIKSHPFKFAQNCISNIGRILFNYPYPNEVQKPSNLIKLPFNGIIVVLMLFCIIPTFTNWKKIPYSIRFLLIFALLYFCGSILGSAETRMFTIIVPILLLWIAYIIQKTIKFKLRFDE